MNSRIAELQGKRRYASVLMTYACTIACDHCCFGCSPRKPPVVIPVADAVECLAEFHQLDRLTHIAGGEPFTFYGHLQAILRAAFERGVPPHFVESNCSWCMSDGLTRERLQELKSLGVLWMLISTDHYHLRHVPLENVLRGVTIAEEVFGPGTTMGRATREELERTLEMGRDETRYADHIREHPPKLVGRAKRVLARYVAPRPISELDLETGWGLNPANTCDAEWDPLWEIHADPYGNLQTNCGIILGNHRETPIAELMQTWHERHPVLKGLSRRGVAYLVEAAAERGFVLDGRYPQKCYLCAELRTHLRNGNGSYRDVFGPDEVYQE